MALALLDGFQSITTLVEMSIGTDRGRWWADKEFGSDLWKIRQAGKVDDTTAQAIKQELERCTAWLVDEKYAKSITAAAQRTGKNTIEWVVTVVRPDGNPETVKDVWNGQ